MMADVLLERGYSYHAMFIYNKPRLKNNRHRNQDFQVSFDVVKFAVNKLASWGFRQTYYHDRDALPGSNIFSEFFDTVKASRFTVVVLTRGFLNDCWGKYKSQAAFAKLLEEQKSRRFIAMYIDLQDQQIPDEFNTMVSLCFNANWQSDDEEWEKFKMLLNNVTQAVQDTGPDCFPVTQTNSGSQNAILTSTGNLQHTRGGLTGNSPLVGLQETNPPNYPRAISIVETDAGPHDTPETTDNLQPDNLNTTNRSNNGNPSNQQSGGGNHNSLGFSVTQSNEGSVIYQRTSTNRLNSNNSASTSSSTTSSLQVENGQSTTQTGPGQTTSVAAPPTTVMSTTGKNIEEQAAQPVASASTAMQNSGTRAQALVSTSTVQIYDDRAQAVASASTTMQTAGTSNQTVAANSTLMHTSASREPPDGAATLTKSPPITMHNSSDTNLKDVVGGDNGNEYYPLSSLNNNDVEPDNNGGSISNSTDDQKSHTGQLPPEQLVRPKDQRLNSQPDSGIEQSLDFTSLASGQQDANGFNTSLIGMNRPNVNIAPTTNDSDGYKSMGESSENSQGASYVLSTMRRMLPAARSTIRNNMGTMIKHSVNIVLKSDQSYI